MITSPRRPFHDLSAEQWQNLALVGIVVFFAAQALLDLYWNNFCGHVAIDYCAFWSAGHIARTHGFAAVYDLQRMEQLQRQIFPEALSRLTNYPVIPTPYLPVFLLPFVLLEPLGLHWGYAVWTVLNVLVLYYYLRSFAAATTGSQPPRRLLVMLLVAYPVFLNLLYGQVNVWLTICIGESMRLAIGGRPFRAGLWLAGLLIKPQYLALIVIVLLMQRSARILAGLAAMSAVILVLSYGMIGGSGFASLAQLWLGFATGIPSTGPSVMMNWRAVGLFLAGFVDARIVWSLVGLAMLLTALAGLATWRKWISPSSSLFSVAILGTLAATCALVWHSHVYSAMILLCPLMMLYQEPRRLPRNALELWVLLPPFFLLASIGLAGAAQAAGITSLAASFVNLLALIVPFGFNLFFMLWALQFVRQVDTPNFGPGPAQVKRPGA